MAPRSGVAVATPLFCVASVIQAVNTVKSDGMSSMQAKRQALAQRVEEMYSHSFESYMAFAFPADELRPLSCDGRIVRERGDLDAILGNYSMTLIDALDSLVIFRRYKDFEIAVTYISENVNFDIDVEVSTFEVNIRLLGGLLSGHMMATQILENYSGGLLTKAVDLVHRLRLAFDTPSGMPTTRVNLRYGKPSAPSNTVTTAEAGSFILEFGVVSLLTADPMYYNVAKRSLLALWHKRSALNLVGTAIDINTGEYQDHQSTTGPGQDSFYEYLLKGYILFDDIELLEMFQIAYSAVEKVHGFEGFTYNVDMFRGLMSNTNLSPLSCVWASTQVLMGDVAAGLRTVLYWYNIWKKHGALPEVFDIKAEAPTSQKDSPLRPELIEAMFYLGQALPGDSEVLSMLSSFVDALDSQSRVPCGFAAVADVLTKRLDDRMDSYFLSETLVYLYLAIAPASVHDALPWSLASTVFSTEGHMLPLPKSGLYQVSRIPGLHKHMEKLYPVAAHKPMLTCEVLSPFERAAVQNRCRTKYILTSSYQAQANGCIHNRCRVQKVTVVARAGDGDELRLEGMASSFGPALAALPSCRSKGGKKDLGTMGSSATVTRNRTGASTIASTCEEEHSQHRSQPPAHELGLSRVAMDRPPGGMGSFAAVGVQGDRFWELFATRHLVVAKPFDACTALRPPAGETETSVEPYEGKIVMVSRGSCLFLQKMHFLQQARASGAIMLNQAGHKELQVMTCPLQDRGAGNDVHIPALMLGYQDGVSLLSLFKDKDAATHVRATLYYSD